MVDVNRIRKPCRHKEIVYLKDITKRIKGKEHFFHVFKCPDCRKHFHEKGDIYPTLPEQVYIFRQNRPNFYTQEELKTHLKLHHQTNPNSAQGEPCAKIPSFSTRSKDSVL